MKIIKLNQNNFTNKELNEISDFFLRGKIVAHKTDTVYGLACDATNKKAVEKIYRIKKKDKQKPLIVLVKSYCMLKKYFYISKKQDVYLRTIWPGPITVILKKRGILPDIVANDTGTASVRLPKSDFLIKMITRLDRPIVSTSLNLTNQPIINDPKQVEHVFKDKKPDILLDSGICRRKKPSQLYDLTDMGDIKRLR